MRWLKENPIPAAILVFALCSAPFIVSSILFRDTDGAYRNEDIPALIEQAAKQAQNSQKDAAGSLESASPRDANATGEHPWLVDVEGAYTRSYIGPQTAEAIVTTILARGWLGGREEELKRIVQKVLDGGFVYQDTDDFSFMCTHLLSWIDKVMRILNGGKADPAKRLPTFISPLSCADGR